MMMGDRARRLMGAIGMMALVGLLSFVMGFYYGTGQMPLVGKEGITYLPPDYTEVNVTTVALALEEDKTDKEEYRVGYNCLDFAWDTMRSLAWKGIPCYIMALEFVDGPQHAVLAIPTSGSDIVWFDPQADIEVEPEVGKMYNGKRVVGIKVMTIQWLTLDEFSQLAKDGNLEDGS